jgi:hypothetical protein
VVVTILAELQLQRMDFHREPGVSGFAGEQFPDLVCFV